MTLTLFAIVGRVSAQASASISAKDITAPSGHEVELPIVMTNDADHLFVGFKFTLTLPEGVTVALNAKGKPIFSLSSRIDAEEFLTNQITKLSDNSWAFPIVGSGEFGVIQGTDGEIMTITLNIADDMADGNYDISLTDVNTNIRDDEFFVQTVNLSSSVSTLTISEVDTRIVLDEEATELPDEAEGVNVCVLRTINANEWSTICLPFSMTEEQTKEAFGSDVQIADFNDYEFNEEAGTITVKFVPATAIEANHPYIIKVAEKVTEFTVDGVDIIPEDEPVVDFDTSRRKNQPRQMVGTYVAGTVLEWGTLFLSGNQFWYSTGNTTMKGFRAYFNFNDLLPDFEEGYESRSITMNFGGGETTGISEIGNSKSSNSKYYDLQGRRVAKPGKGLFVKDGKKVIIK